MNFSEYLKKNNACQEARDWAGDMPLNEVWQKCERGDWMLWLMQNAKMCDLHLLVLAKAKCAELAKPYMKDQRSMKALQAAFDFAEGRINRKKLAADAADAADAAADAVAYAAYAAAYAAYAAADAAYAAADTAAYAAYAAYADGNSRIKTLKRCADICREVLPIPQIKELF